MVETLRRLTPPPTLTISEWADGKRRLSADASAEPGKWNTHRAEYQRGIMDAVADPEIGKVVVIKGAQVGWTEIINNCVGFHIDQDPASLLVIQPTVEMAEAWSRERLAPMLRDTPALAGKVHDPRSRDSGNTVRQKLFPGGRLAIIGANAPAGLASRPIRVVLADEVDRYPVSAGTEGDPLALAAKRQITFWNRKALIGSTPTRKGTSVIEREWEASDQRRFFVPCPHCGHRQHLRWAQVRWDKTDAGGHLPDTAHYVCEGCGAIWDDVDRWIAIESGEWTATRPDVRGVAGFHVPGFLSSWLTFEEVVREFLRARKDPQLLQVWVNTVLGESWEEPAEKVEASGLLARGENYTPETIPAGAMLLGCGVDVQGNRLEAHVLAFGAHEETWSVAYDVLPGDPAQKQVWDDLSDYLLSSFRTEDGRTMRIRSTCIDTGGHHPAHVLAFCRGKRKLNVFPIKGAAGPRPIWPKRASKTKTNDHVFIVGVDTAKDAIYGRLRIDKPGPGYMHFPVGQGYDQAFFDQLTAEHVVTRKREGLPYRVWVLPEGRRNEALDTTVYALAARHALPIRLDIGTRADHHAAAEAAKAAARAGGGHVTPPTAAEDVAEQRQVAAAAATARGGARGRRVMRSSYMSR